MFGAKSTVPGSGSRVRESGEQSNPAMRPVSVAELSDDTFDAVGEVTLANQASGLKTAYTHDGRFMYFVAKHPDTGVSELHELDLQNPFKIARTVPLPDGDFRGLAVHCASSKVFVSDAAGRCLWVVNRNYFAVQWRINLDAAPGALELSPAGDLLYVLSADGDALWAINPNSNWILCHLRNLGRGPSLGARGSDGSRMYVSHWCADGGVCVARVRRAAPTARTVYAVDRRGNCRVSQVPARVCLVA